MCSSAGFQELGFVYLYIISLISAEVATLTPPSGPCLWGRGPIQKRKTWGATAIAGVCSLIRVETYLHNY